MRLEKIEQAQAQNGTPYLKVTIDGKAYNYWKPLEDMKVGDFVECEFQKKGQYTNLMDMKKINYQVVGSPQVQPQVATSEVIVQRVEKPHSYEFGKAGARHKIYYNEVKDLVEHMRLLKVAGLLDEDLPTPKNETGEQLS